MSSDQATVAKKSAFDPQALATIRRLVAEENGQLVDRAPTQDAPKSEAPEILQAKTPSAPSAVRSTAPAQPAPKQEQAPQPETPEPARVEAQVPVRKAPRPVRKLGIPRKPLAPPRKADTLPKIAAAEVDDTASLRTLMAGQPGRRITKRKELKPQGRFSAAIERFKHGEFSMLPLVLVAAVWAAIYAPFIVLGVLVLTLAISAVFFVILGYDGFWSMMMSVAGKYIRRRPSQSGVWRQRINRLTDRTDAILDRFPEGSVDALYLPDFSQYAKDEKRHEDVVARRLAGLH